MLYIVILNWNTTELVQRAINSIENCTKPPYRIVIVDNGSRPEQLKALEEAYPLPRPGRKLRRQRVWQIVHLPHNVGCPPARNLALNLIEEEQEGRDYDVVLMDSDIEISDPEWVNKVREVLTEHSLCGIVGLKRGRDERGSSPVFHFPTPDGRLYWYQWPELSEGGEGESVGFGFVFIRGDLVRAPYRLRFDTRYEFYDGQDQDFCFHARALGWECWTVPVQVQHWGSGALYINDWKISDEIQGPEAVQAMRHRNQRRFIEKWRDFLAPARRQSVAEEMAHLAAMKAKFTAMRKGGELKRKGLI